MSHEIGETYEVYDEKFPTARRLHHCDACREEIHPGHRYARVGIVFHEEVETVKRCMRCQKIHEHLRSLDPGEMWPAERLDCGESYQDHWGAEPPEDIAALAFALPADFQRDAAE